MKKVSLFLLVIFSLSFFSVPKVVYGDANSDTAQSEVLITFSRPGSPGGTVDPDVNVPTGPEIPGGTNPDTNSKPPSGPVFGGKNPIQNNHAALVLPQTNEKSSPMVTILGIILLFIGITIILYERKERRLNG